MAHSGHEEHRAAIDASPHPKAGRKIMLLGGVPLLLAGIVLSVLSFASDSFRFSFAYLVGFIFVWGIVLGSLFFIALHHAASVVWSVVVRRVAEMLAYAIPLVALLYIPVVLFAENLFPWMDPEFVAHNPTVQAKVGYLNFPFFLTRGVIFFLLWIIFSFAFIRWSIRQDAKAASLESTGRIRRFAPAFLIIFAFTLAFSAFDWLMSLEPHWFSTIFAVYVFAGVVVSFLSVLALIVLGMRRAGLFGRNTITDEHIYNIGALLFAFSCFWGYIALSQYLLIWYANIPEETFWFIRRAHDGAEGMSYVLIALRFIIPFVALIGRTAKKSGAWLAFIACLTLLGQWVDIQWLVMPSISPESPVFQVLDIGPLLLLSGLILLVFGWNVSRHPAIPINDPLLDKSLRFRLRI